MNLVDRAIEIRRRKRRVGPNQGIVSGGRERPPDRSGARVRDTVNVELDIVAIVGECNVRPDPCRECCRRVDPHELSGTVLHFNPEIPLRPRLVDICIVLQATRVPLCEYWVGNIHAGRIYPSRDCERPAEVKLVVLVGDIEMLLKTRREFQSFTDLSRHRDREAAGPLERRMVTVAGQVLNGIRDSRNPGEPHGLHVEEQSAWYGCRIIRCNISELVARPRWIRSPSNV